MTSTPSQKLCFGSVLLIDDEASLIVVARERLRRADFDVVGTYTIRDAKMELKRRKFNAIVLDLNLDGRSGTEILTFLRTEPTPNSGTPVYVVSGQLRKEDLAELRPRVSAFLVKPIDFDKLIRILKSGPAPPSSPSKAPRTRAK